MVVTTDARGIALTITWYPDVNQPWWNTANADAQVVPKLPQDAIWLGYTSGSLISIQHFCSGAYAGAFRTDQGYTLTGLYDERMTYVYVDPVLNPMGITVAQIAVVPVAS